MRPCRGVVHRSKDRSPLSQEFVHLPIRAKFGLLSNLADMLGERPGGLPERSLVAEVHAHRTPEESHVLLKTSDEELQNHDLNSDPFDWDLLRREVGFVQDYLKDFDEGLVPKCRFMKGLAEMKKQFNNAKKNKEEWATREFNYLSSAEGAERRSNRLPWGCMMPGAKCESKRTILFSILTPALIAIFAYPSWHSFQTLPAV